MNICRKDKIIMGMIVVLIIIVSANYLRYYVEKKESPRMKALDRDKEFMEGKMEKEEEHPLKAVFSRVEETAEKINDAAPIIKEDESTGSSAITVDIDGEVMKPGVYKVDGNARMNELIKMAGGFTEKARTKGINKAKKLQDEGYYYIPSVDEEDDDYVQLEVAAAVEKDTGGKIDINSATASELMEIPGVGEVRAAEIVRYREENGGFKSIEDMMNISGIGLKTFQKMKDTICVK